MRREALGLVETRGFVAAVEAADAMCKTAEVRLAGYEHSGDGRVTVWVRGALAAVEAAVAVGAARASGRGTVLASHVIPTPDPALEAPVATAALGRRR